MRLGKVFFYIEYVVDLDNEAQCREGKEAIYEDIISCYSHDEIYNLIKFEECGSNDFVTEDDIPEFLKGPVEYEVWD